MSTIKEKALKSAMRTLDAIGAEYAIFFEDHLYGDLEVKDIEPVKENVGRRHENYGKFAKVYQPIVDNMEVGDVTVIPYTEVDALGTDRENFRVLVLEYTRRIRGSGSLMTAMGLTGIELLRLK